ncbi:MAG: diguanylate cyclase [Rhodopseudomonas sp.]|uniref:GGDEF domain-containing protein n=1 Tax=Rhodopseudomonas sp. TaxID=1078 RepID=UPI00184C8953|nr:diguanylate cyclase [Rhodopseudomonas sp.]NVN88709.1 diguanylate cyclase [Rhodopseudomonas sp.]
MSYAPLSLVTVEAYMDLPRKRAITFPAEIERQFEADTNANRCRRLTIGILVSAVLYNFFLIADWLLVPDALRLASWLHFAVVTPWMLIVAWAISRRPRPVVREFLAASVPVLIILQIDAGFAVTTSDSAAHYQYVVIPTILYTNVSLHRLAFRFARIVTAIILLCHTALVLSVSYLPGGVAAMILVQIAICAYITLVANFTMERDLRRAYLYALRDRLRHAEADAAARHDTLTGLANRHHLDEELQKLWAAPNHATSYASIVMLDVDHFKRLNDGYGHGAGDLCLKRIAAILIANLRGTDDCAIRYGGEEFLLLLPGLQLVDAMHVAERIRQAIEDAAIPNEGSSLGGVITASLGVAACHIGELSASELIDAADAALYAAKTKGRNQVWPPLASAEARTGQLLSRSPDNRG